MVKQTIDSELKKCELEGCNNYFQEQFRGRKRNYCCDQHKWKAIRLSLRKKARETDFVRLQKQKIVVLLTPKQKKKAHDWGLLD